MSSIEKDSVSGRQTTGHVWDGIKELNTPLPSWWLYVLYATILWSIGYWVVYPAIPLIGDYTRGLLGYSSRGEVAEQMRLAAAARAQWNDQIDKLPVDQIAANPELLTYAIAGGRAVFATSCTQCHGAGGQGAPGFPILADDDWLWGGDLASIERTVRFGIRSGHPEAHLSEMPRFGIDQILSTEQIADVSAYVLSLSGQAADGDATARGQAVFAEQCAACHGEDGKGNLELGAPNLTDQIWLYGGPDAVAAQVGNPRHGVMPTWEGRLDNASLKMVTIYVHSLGGGK
jgi:cytochrome c oxidase cbb3-type subunit III